MNYQSKHKKPNWGDWISSWVFCNGLFKVGLPICKEAQNQSLTIKYYNVVHWVNYCFCLILLRTTAEDNTMKTPEAMNTKHKSPNWGGRKGQPVGTFAYWQGRSKTRTNLAGRMILPSKEEGLDLRHKLLQRSTINQALYCINKPINNCCGGIDKES